MNLYAHHPYWLMKDGIQATYISLDKDLAIDVAIMGGGISAALVAYSLRNAGLSVAVFDRRHVGMGSTAASTAFLQYEIDTPLNELRNYVGEANAVKSYELCRKAIYDIGKICGSMKPEFDFHIRPSLQYASYKKHRDKLYEECKIRLKHGFEVDWLEPEDLLDKYDFEAAGAILSKDGGEVDAYMLTHTLLKKFAARGHKVYNNTEIKNVEHRQRSVTLTTDKGHTIKAKKLVIAAGYESLKYVPKTIAEIHSTYALVSEPITTDLIWYKHSLVWETADLYMYFRMVDGDKILVGGKDDRFHPPHIADSRIKMKAEMLRKSFCKIMKHIDLKPDFSWAGAFAITKDGLPYIGSIPERPNTYFALGFGGNGITFSVIAAEIIHDLLLNKKNENAALFGFNR